MRRAALADADRVTAFVQEAYGHYVEPFGFRPGPMDDDYAREISEKEVWIAPEEGPIEALLVLRPETDHLYVDNVAVAPARRGDGWGRRLLEFSEDRARELGVPELRLITNSLMAGNRAMYAHLGWTEGEPFETHGFTLVPFTKPAPD